MNKEIFIKGFVQGMKFSKSLLIENLTKEEINNILEKEIKKEGRR